MPIKSRQVTAKPSADQKGQEAVIHTTVQVKRPDYNFGDQYTTVVDREERITVPLFATAPAYVRVSGGVTRTTQPYNSVKVSVDISLPCYPEGSEIERAYEVASTWVNQKVQDEVSYAYGREEGSAPVT